MATYTCIGKGGRYEVVAVSIGAGKSRGETIVVYEDIESGDCFHRSMDDFRERMEITEDDE